MEKDTWVVFCPNEPPIGSHEIKTIDHNAFQMPCPRLIKIFDPSFFKGLLPGMVP